MLVESLALVEVLALLAPIGLYCLALSAINRRTSPVVVRGVWDALGLLFAASGFLLGTVPMLIGELYSPLKLSELIKFRFDRVWATYWAVVIAYFLLVLAGGAFLVARRARKTMIYNINPDLFLENLKACCAPVGLAVTKQHRHVIIEQARSDFTEAITEATPVAPANERRAELEIDAFPALCHVTLHWDHCTPHFREEIEDELRKGMRNVISLDNPASGWLLSVGGLIFGTIIVVCMMIVAMKLLFHR